MNLNDPIKYLLEDDVHNYFPFSSIADLYSFLDERGMSRGFGKLWTYDGHPVDRQSEYEKEHESK